MNSQGRLYTQLLNPAPLTAADAASDATIYSVTCRFEPSMLAITSVVCLFCCCCYRCVCYWHCYVLYTYYRSSWIRCPALSSASSFSSPSQSTEVGYVSLVNNR